MKNTFHVTEEVRKSIRRIQELLKKRTGHNLTPDQIVAVAIKNMEKMEELENGTK